MSAIEKVMQKIKLESQPVRVVSEQLGAADQKPKAHEVNIEVVVERDDVRVATKTSGSVTIDMPELVRQGFVSTDAVRTPLNEQFRQIKRPVLRHAFNEEGRPIDNKNFVVVVSSVANEGKTFCALNLALSIAKEKERTVLLVDGDSQRRSLSELIGVSDQKGLLDYLDDRSVQLADVMLRTNVKNLSFVPAGTHTMQATELLASDRMQQLADELAQRYPDRLVIVDAPPLGMTSEARVLVGLAGQILMVVAAASTPQHLVLNAINQIPKEKQVGFVLNKQVKADGYEQQNSYYN